MSVLLTYASLLCPNFCWASGSDHFPVAGCCASPYLVQSIHFFASLFRAFGQEFTYLLASKLYFLPYLIQCFSMSSLSSSHITALRNFVND